VWRIGWLSNVSPAALGKGPEAARLAFRELGHIEGQNLVIDFRWSDAPDSLSALATEFVGLKVDAIVAVGPPAILAAKQATTTFRS
jgi:putative ABC transport system substrate-binding protein